MEDNSPTSLVHLGKVNSSWRLRTSSNDRRSRETKKNVEFENDPRNWSFDDKMTRISRTDGLQLQDSYSAMEVKSRHKKILNLVNQYGSKKFDDVRSLYTHDHNGIDVINEALKTYHDITDRQMDIPIGSIS